MENMQILEGEGIMFERDVYEDAKEKIEGLIKDFVFVTKEQVVFFMDGEKELAGKVLSVLVRRGKIGVFNTNEYGEPIEYVSDPTFDKKTEGRASCQKALCVYLDYKKHLNVGAYCVGADDLIIMTFEVDGELYDVLRLKVGDERSTPNLLRMKERYLAPEDRENLHRIIMLDDERQMEDFDPASIIGVERVVVVDYEGHMRDIKFK